MRTKLRNAVVAVLSSTLLVALMPATASSQGGGTHVGGIVGGDGTELLGAQMGIAPETSSYSLQVLNDDGSG